MAYSRSAMEIALGALTELQYAGKAVQGEIAVVGFDGIRMGAHTTPPLSTIEPDFEVAGAMLVDKILASIAGEARTARRVPVRLLQRGSA